MPAAADWTVLSWMSEVRMDHLDSAIDGPMLVESASA